MIMVKFLLVLTLCMYLTQNHLPGGPVGQVDGQKMPGHGSKADRRKNAVRYKAIQEDLEELKQLFGEFIKFTKDERFGLLITISHVIMPIILGMNFTMMLYLTSVNMIPRGEATHIEGEYDTNNALHRQREAPNGPPSYEEATNGDNEFTEGSGAEG